MQSTKKQTKIVCTIGPSSNTPVKLKQLIKAGMNVARLNFSHGTHADHAKIVRTVRAAAKETGEPVTVLQDLSGPKMRVGDLPEGGIKLKKGEEIQVSFGKAYKPPIIPVSYPNIHKDIRPGEQILLDDGLLELQALRSKGKILYCKVIVGGMLLPHKGFNVPTSVLKIDTITQKDRKDLQFGLKQNVDWVTLSFVRSSDDIKNLKSLIKRYKKTGVKPKIMAKIEKQEALNDLEAIVKECDGIMIARGDLAVETAAEQMPVHQKDVIEMCLKHQKAVVVATQMMDSMTKNPRPTRAELSDVGHAVMDHTDGVMTSGESATGKYPVKTVSMMAKIAFETEKSRYDDYPLDQHFRHRHTRDRIVGTTARLLEKHSNIAAIGFLPGQEDLARLVAHFRAQVPLVVGVRSLKAAQQLNVFWGIHGVVVSGSDKSAIKKQLLKWMTKNGLRKGRVAAFLNAQYGTADERFELGVEERTL